MNKKIGMLLLLAHAGALSASAQTLRVWTNTAAATAWYTAANWNPSTTSSAWATNDTARFENSGSATTAGINMNTASLSIGGIEMTSVRTRALTIGNSSTTAGTLTLSGATINSIPHVIVRNASGSNLTLQDNETGSGKTMNIALGSAVTNRVQLDGSGNITISSVIRSAGPGTRPFVFGGSGGGRVEITGTANTFTGTIFLIGAEVRFAANGSFGHADNLIVIDGGRLATVSASTYTLASTHGIQVSAAAGNSISVVSSGTLTYDGVIANYPSTVGSWAKQGGGTLALGGVSTYGGDTRINNGRVQLTTGNDRLPTGTTVFVGQASSSNLGVLDLNGRNQTIAGLNSVAGSNASSTTNNFVTSASAATLTISGSGSYSFSAGTAANSGLIGGALSLVKSGSGTQFLGQANIYTGKTTINGGALAASGESRFGANPGSFTADQITLNGGAIRAQGGGINFSSNRGLTLGSSGGTFDAADGDITLQNVVAGSGALTKIGARNVIISGAHTYSGNTLIAEGGLQFASGGSLANSTNITIAGNATANVSVVGYTMPSGQSLTAPGSGTTGTVLTASGNNLVLGSSTPLRFTAYKTNQAPLAVVGAGSMNLAADTPVSVVVSNGGAALGAGSYKLIAKGATGSVGGTAPTSVTVGGDGLVGGASASLSITGGELFLTVTIGGPSAPSVTTAAATATNTTTATIGGNVTADGGATVTNRGVVYKTSSGVTISDNKTQSGSGTGAFTADLTSLAVNQQYYFRAYAQNSAGTTLGSELSFWTWANTPSAPTVNTPSSSSLNVDVNTNGNPATTLFSIQVTNSSQFVQTNGTLGATEHWRTDSDWGVVTVTGLSSDTEYGFRVRARNGEGTLTAYSVVGTNRTLVASASPPTVSTTVASATNQTTATAGGNVTADGGASVTNRGVVWALSPATPTVPGAQTTNGTGTGSFSSTLTNLIPGATYNYRAFAQNSAGTGYGATQSLTTPCFTGVVLNVRASVTNENDFTAAWDAFANATGYALDVSTLPTFSSVASTNTIFRETMGTVGSTTAIATHEAADGFDNDGYTMSDGGAANPADVRITNTSTGYTDPDGNIASSGANIFFTSTTGDRGFSIDGITNAAGYGSFLLHFGYRKESASDNASFNLQWSTNNGAAWNAITVSNLPSAGAGTGWYFVSNLFVSGAASSTNLSLRWVKTGGTAMRIDDVLLQGITDGSAPAFVPGYSNRVASGTSQSVTGLVSGATYYFRVRATNANCATANSATQSVTTVSTADVIPPTFSGFNIAGATYTDYELRSGFSITGLVFDAGGVSNAAHTPFLFIKNSSNQFVLGSNKFDTAPANGTTVSSPLAENVGAGVFSNIVTGVYTATVGALDLAGNLGLSNFTFTVVDDDVLPPAASGFRLAGGGTNVDLSFSSVTLTGLVGDASLPFGGTNGTAHALVYNSLGSIVASSDLHRTSFPSPTNNFFGFIAIIGFDSSGSGDDEFTFVALREIPQGQAIVFTDRGYDAVASPRFRIDEETDIWTAPYQIKPGTVIRRFNTLNLSGTGDQIFALTNAVAITNDAAAPGFLHGVNFNGSPPPWQSDNSSQNDSTVPTNLTGIYNVDVYEHQAAFYSGIRTGTAEQILTAIANTANWTRIVSGSLDLTTNMQPFTVLQSVTGSISTLNMVCSSTYTVRVVVVDADVDRPGDQLGMTNSAVTLRTLGIPGPSDAPKATNLLVNGVIAGTNAILTDAQVRTGGWNIALGFTHPVGVVTNPTAPSFRITNSLGVVVGSTTFTNPATNATSVFYTNPAPGVAYADVALGLYAVQWSAANLGECSAAVTNSSVITGGTNTFTVIDNDTEAPIFFEHTVAGVGMIGDALPPGGIAIVGVNGHPATGDGTGGGESFSFVVLTPFPEGTRIWFTDAGWSNNNQIGWSNTNEFHLAYWDSTGGEAVGSVVTLVMSNLNNAGDQMVVYQYDGVGDPKTNPAAVRFIHAVNLGSEWLDTHPGGGGTNNQNSALYRGLTNFVTAVDLPGTGSSRVNWQYTGPRTGTASFVLAQINTRTNWQQLTSTTDYNFNTIFAGGFEILGPGDAPWDNPVLTDAQVLTGSYAVTGGVQDITAGLLATGTTWGAGPYYYLTNPDGLVVASNLFPVNFANGNNTPRTLALTNAAGIYENITLGSYFSRIVVSDNDNNRPNDNRGATNRISVTVIDDDTDPPVAGTNTVSVLLGGAALPRTNLVELLAGWNFNVATARMAVSHGLGSLVNNLSTTNSNTGDALNAYAGDAAGSDLTVQAAANIGRYIQFDVDMTGRRDLAVSFAARRSSTGYNSNIVAFAVNGGSFTTINAAWSPTLDAWGLNTFSLSSYPEVNGAALVSFRITFGTNNVTGGGNNRFDNFQFNADYSTYYEITDAQLAAVSGANPLRFSFNAFDAYSGLARGTVHDGTNMFVNIDGVATNNTAAYQSGLSSAATTNANATSLWQFTSFSYDRIGELFADGQSNRPIRATTGDADNDRPGDTLWLTNVTYGLFRVIDDDTNTPAVVNVDYPNASARPFIVLTNGGTFASGETVRSLDRRTGTGTNTTWTISDGDLAASGTIGLQFSFGARDVYSGVARGNAGTTNSVMSFSLGDAISGNFSNYNASLSTVQTTTNQILTNIWSFGSGSFDAASITALMATNIGVNPLATTTRTLRVTIPDTDNDRTNDAAILTSTQVGRIRITDDDARGPVISSVVAEGTTGNEQSFYESFEPALGWTNGTSFSGSWTNTYSNGTYIASGSVLWGSLDPKVSGTRRIGLLTNVAVTTTWLQLPPVADPGTLTVLAGRFGGEDPTNDVPVSLERRSGSTWVSLGTQTVSALNPEFEMLSWNINQDTITTLRLVRVATTGVQVYMDDISITPNPDWISTNQLTIRWSEGVDDYSNLDEYRIVAPAIGAAVPAATNAGVRRAPGITNDTFSIVGHQGVITGFVFAIDDDNDRTSDRALGNLKPIVVRIDTNPPPQATSLRATDAAGGYVFDSAIDESSEIKVEWRPGGTNAAQAAGWRQSDSVPLSPWDSYLISYYEVDGTNGTPAAGAVTTTISRTTPAWSAILTNYAFTNLVLSNLIFDTYYKIEIRGRDEAGNIGLVTSVIGNTDRFIVTQGLARVDRDLEVRWTGNPTDTNRWYDVLYVDGPFGFRNTMSNQWTFMQRTNNPSMYDNGTITPIKPGDLTNTTYRFYRVARPDRWQTNQNPRVGSVEIYVAKAVKLHPGENWHSLFSFPDPATTNEMESTVAYVFGTNLLPRGSSLLNATKISWFGTNTFTGNDSAGAATAVVWLANSGNWTWHVGGSGFANDKRVPLGQGFLIELPTSSNPTNLIMIGRLPTQELVHVIASPAAAPTNPVYHVLSHQMPERVSLINLGINTNNGFKGGPNIGQSDEIRILSNKPVTNEFSQVVGSGSLVSPKARIWWRTTDNTWRHAASANFASGDSASGYVIEPDDTVILVRRYTNSLVWTNRPVFYSPPNRNFTP